MINMVNKLRFNIAKFGAKIASQVSKLGFGSGNNLPGYVFYKVAGKEALKDLAHEMNVGPILITGTNGKTTTTTLLIKLLSCDTEIRKSFESNTIHAITTGILKGSGDIGVLNMELEIKFMEFQILFKGLLILWELFIQQFHVNTHR